MSEHGTEKMAWHREGISAPAEALMHELGEHGILEGAYLAGGTGLALHFGHRVSVDLDFFLGREFHEEEMLQSIQLLPGVAMIARSPQTLHLAIQDVKVSFLGYRYPLLFQTAPFDGVSVADPRDIACMKISAVSSRGTKRDFIDLYTACQRFGFGETLELFARKYARPGYSRIHVLKSLTYFADAEKDPMPHMLIEIEWPDVKRFFEREAPKLQ